MIEAEEDSILTVPRAKPLVGSHEAWKKYPPVMHRLAVPVLSLLFLAAPLHAATADPAPPLEAVWHLPYSVLGEPALGAGIASASDGSVYVVEVGVNRVQKFDADGHLLERWGAPAGEPAALEKPFGIAVGPDDSVYVTEMGTSRVRHFDAHGAELKAWGGVGTQNGRFREPRGIAANANGHVYVVDGENHRLQCFSAEGRFLNLLGSTVLISPVGVAVTPAGDLLVSDVGTRCVQRFKPDGTLVGSLRPTDGFAAFNFWPESVSVAEDGTAFVADPWAAQVLEFSSEGRFLRRWPDPETGPQSIHIVSAAQGISEGTPPRVSPNPFEGRAELKTPLALDVDRSKRLLLLDRGMAQVRIYKP